MLSTDLTRRSTILIVDDEWRMSCCWSVLKRESLTRLPAQPETERPLFE